MTKEQWAVTFEHGPSGYLHAYTVEAVGFSQAATFAADALARDGHGGPEYNTVAIVRIEPVPVVRDPESWQAVAREGRRYA